MDIKIPKLGDGVSSGTVVSILVKEGDVVKKDQTVLEMETEKAVAPIPASEGGTVSKILVKEGEKVSVGQPIMTLSGSGSTTTSSAPAAPKVVTPAAPAQSAPSAPAPAYVPPSNVAAGPLNYYYQSSAGAEPPASPTVRKVAKELGIDLRRVRGTEHGGRITMEDLKSYVQQLQTIALSGGGSAAPAAAYAPAPQAAPAESIDFSKWGPVTKKQPSNLRKTIGKKMAESWNAIPHVTQFEEADITQLMELRKKYVPAYEKKKANLTVTGMMLKSVVAALKKYPGFNSSLDEATGEIVYKNYYHIGIAVDTEAGLIVPVIRDVDKKSIKDLSIELAELAEKTRQRKVTVEDLSGGTFTISNLGSIGGSFFTPIVNKPQVAILGVSRGVQKAVVVKPESKSKAVSPKIEIRTIMPLSLSYDHRVIDGADGARFIRELVNGLENFKESDLKI